VRGVSSTRIGVVGLMVWSVDNANESEAQMPVLEIGVWVCRQLNEEGRGRVAGDRGYSVCSVASRIPAYACLMCCGTGHRSGHGISALSHAYVVHRSCCVHHVMTKMATPIIPTLILKQVLPNHIGETFEMS
jgi:hypothetical protein